VRKTTCLHLDIVIDNLVDMTESSIRQIVHVCEGVVVTAQQHKNISYPYSTRDVWFFTDPTLLNKMVVVEDQRDNQRVLSNALQLSFQMLNCSWRLKQPILSQANMADV
jgi:hypothetical protein